MLSDVTGLHLASRSVSTKNGPGDDPEPHLSSHAGLSPAHDQGKMIKMSFATLAAYFARLMLPGSHS